MLFELNDLRFVYPDGTAALLDVTTEIAAGERVAILGANGSGKSTLLRMLNGLVHPTSGRVLFEGTEITEKNLNDPSFQFSFRQRVGFVFQDSDAQMFNGSVWEEVAFGPRQLGLTEQEVTRRVEDTLSFLGIRNLSERAPFRLSGGEKKKVAIASVLSMNPEVLLLDEPLLALDPKMQMWLIRTLNELQSAGKTTIIATHSLQTLSSIASRALVLSEDHSILGDYKVNDILNDRVALGRANLIFEGTQLETAFA
jgi:cobalt/nickel transport system ATP-binding protein